jgi:4-hydroxybenzoate polyprenyltransferase
MRWAVWLRLGRVSNLPTVWSNVLAALALSGPLPGLPSLLALCGTFSLYYVAGMYLNDAFDRHVDAHERPSRPIPSGQAPAWLVFALGFGGLALAIGFSVLIAAQHAPASMYRTLALGFALAAFIVGYNLHHKHNPLSPLVMGLCRVFVYATAAMAVAGEVERAVWLGSAALLSHLIGLTYAAKQETLRQVENAWPLLFLILPPAYGIYLGLQQPWVFAFVLVLVLWVLHSLRFLWDELRRSIPAAVVRLIAGIALLDAMLIASAGPLWVAISAATLCALTRVLQRVIPGT